MSNEEPARRMVAAGQMSEASSDALIDVAVAAMRQAAGGQVALARGSMIANAEAQVIAARMAPAIWAPESPAVPSDPAATTMSMSSEHALPGTSQGSSAGRSRMASDPPTAIIVSGAIQAETMPKAAVATNRPIAASMLPRATCIRTLLEGSEGANIRPSAISQRLSARSDSRRTLAVVPARTAIAASTAATRVNSPRIILDRLMTLLPCFGVAKMMPAIARPIRQR